jgi:hypothetical protein
MNKVETARRRPSQFRKNSFVGWNIILRRWEDFGQPCNILLVQKHDKVDVMCKARLAIENRRDAAGYDVSNTGAIHWPNKQKKKFSFGHEGKYA